MHQITAIICAAMIGAYCALVDVAPPSTIRPLKALAFAREHGLTAGRVFNDYNFGGFLIKEGIPTIMDGRAVTFSHAQLLRYFAMKDLPAQLDEYGVTWALVVPGSQAMQWFSTHWRVRYSDKDAVVYEKP